MAAGAASPAGSPWVWDYMDFGIQLGRRFRALKAWMVLRALGRSGIVARIREHRRLAKLFASWIEADEDFATLAPLTMAVVCFRFQPGDVSAREADALNEGIVIAVNAGGRAYITHTRLAGRIAIRVGIGNILTTEQHIADAWRRIRTAAKELSSS